MAPDATADPARRLVVAIDGPAASGKTSVGAAVAARLGLRFCDTGLLYRAVTYAARLRGIDVAAVDRLVPLAAEIRLEADGAGRYAIVTLDGLDVTEAVHSPDVDAHVSAYARIPELRAALLGRQREIAARGGVVMAGRDIGTVVLPDADVKVYLDASVEERARRRTEERAVAPDSPAAAVVLEQLRARDEHDASRPVAPLRRPADAITIATDGLSFDASVDRVADAVTAHTGGPGASPADHGPGTSPTEHDPGPRPAARQRVPKRPPPKPTPIASRVTWVIRIGSFVMRVVARLFTRVVIEGDVGAIPRTGAVLIAANHASNADPVLIGGFLNNRLGRAINWMGKREVFDWPVISWLARHGGVHPVDRGAADVEAFRTAMRILGEGNILAVFPEGTRSPDGRLQAAKDGITVLAARSGALIVPIGIGNSDLLWPRGRKLPVRTPRVTVRIGVPFRLADALAAEAPSDAGPDGESSITSRRRSNAAGTEIIMRRIAELLPERQRGLYGDSPDAG